MTQAELDALPPLVDLPTAGIALRMGRAKAYKLARNDQFPCKIILNESRKMVTKASIFKKLDLPMPGSSPAVDGASSAELHVVS